MQLNIKTPGTTDEVRALRTLFEDTLKSTYWSERTLSAAFEQILQYISSKDIVRIVTLQSVNANIHADRLEKIFESIGIPAQEKRFDALDSLLNEIEIKISQTEPGSVRDAAVIALIQLIIHCEIASYGTLRSFAISLKEDEVVTLLERNLDDEKDLDLQLSVIAEAYINDEAANREI